MSELLALKGVGPKTVEKLNKMGIFSFGDLLERLPVDYIDFAAPSFLPLAEEGGFVFLCVRVEKVSKPFRKGRMTMFRASARTHEGDKVALTFYNSTFALKQVAEGADLHVYGKLRKQKGYELINPAYERAEEGKWVGIRPIYHTKGCVPQASFLGFMREAIGKVRPESVLDTGISLWDGYRMAHFPVDKEEIIKGRERVLYEKLVRRIAAFRLVRAQGERELTYADSPMDDAFKALPFRLTPTQAKGVETVRNILLGNQPLNAMVVGDVGSGKTAVALLAMLFAVRSGYQAALMAPTGILAAQHAETAEKWFGRFGLRVTLLTGNLTAKEKKERLSAIAGGDADFIIGTHAVFSKGVEYKKLGLAVIDEQHRFGVAQRTALLRKGGAVDTLTLSATPIPRSLRLTAFGDVDVIEVAPRYERENISTALVGKAKKKNMLDYIASECRTGKQAYVVCPRIVDGEGEEQDSVSVVYKSLCRLYPDVKFGLLHGKMKGEQKDAVLADFRAGKISVLVSTTVVEVGIDVPNATLMVIFGAERFGLASLHQLRGRIGRNGEKSYCFLYTEQDGENERLSTLCSEREGMKIAERDYELRGGGDWLGLTQSGKGDYVSLQMIENAKRLADTVNLEKHGAELLAYAEQLSLERVSLN